VGPYPAITAQEDQALKEPIAIIFVQTEFMSPCMERLAMMTISIQMTGALKTVKLKQDITALDLKVFYVLKFVEIQK